MIVPALNEAERLPLLLTDLAGLRAQGHEVIVVDGGSTDGTTVAALGAADRVLASPPGRARQMNAGAAAATGDLLWFVHADTRVPPMDPVALIEPLQRGRYWGRCKVRLSADRPMFRVIAAMMNLRSCVTGVATGDQGLLVTRDAFRTMGGFPGIPLMEDVALSRSLKRAFGRPVCLGIRLTTSSRRWEERGVWRTILLMWSLRFAYWLGADPGRLARRYR